MVVSEIIWSGIAASIITLCGVMLSNSSNTRRLRMQLQHESREKTQERLSELRKTVYLEAIEEIEAANISLASILSRDLKDLTIQSELQAIAAAMAKLRLVADSETSKIAGELGVEFGSTFMRLLPRLTPVHQAKTDIEIHQKYSQTYEAESARVMKDMQSLVEAGRAGEENFEFLQRAHDFFSGQSRMHSEKLALAFETYNLSQQKFGSELWPEMKALSLIQLKLLISIRKGLGIPCDVEELQRQFEGHWAVMGAEVEKSMSDLSAGLSLSKSK